ncbi:hypothetical protein B0H16DRAFT_1729621 [Mycena metata]|uniref:Uncharacterized protein n=1 Tax=Mycena metata TaxID=1033252 RepID=A0AAD7IAT4_9AGAR|nr:hypothetical protein B0H16DRAFT_1729621 [Mycena metata]
MVKLDNVFNDSCIRKFCLSFFLKTRPRWIPASMSSHVPQTAASALLDDVHPEVKPLDNLHPSSGPDAAARPLILKSSRVSCCTLQPIIDPEYPPNPIYAAAIQDTS